MNTLRPLCVPLIPGLLLVIAGTLHAEDETDLYRHLAVQQTGYELAPPAPLPEGHGHGAAHQTATEGDHGEHGDHESHGGHGEHADHGAQGGHDAHGGHGDHGGHGGHEEHGGWLLRTPPGLAEHGIMVHGYLSQGISGVANNPADGFNGVVAFNDRDGEYQMNQLWFTIAREAQADCCGLDIGGRIDVTYGSDARFMTSTDGLDSNWNQSQRFYGAALPQLYFDVAYSDWTFRFGKFFTFLEYEEDESTRNFFYSHSYAKEYGEPVTHTGMLGIYDLADQLELKAGLHRGWNQFEDTDGHDSVGFLGGFTWTSCDELMTLSWGITASEQGPHNNVVMYDLVASMELTDRLSYVFQHDWGQSHGGHAHHFAEGDWYGICQYLYYEINPCWSAGTRFEWFRDDDGARVAGHGNGNATHHGGFEGNFYELTLGLNWTPTDNLRVRPEVRWDWFEGHDGGLGHRPYDAGDQNEQFLVGVDAVLLF